MIFAAGKGTRLGRLTSDTPKALVKINGISMLENAIRKVSGHGFKEIIVNVHHFAGQIIDFLESKNNFGLDIKISDERELLLETGGALKKASWFLEGEEPFLVYNVDVLTDLDLDELIKAHQESSSLATMAVRHRDTVRYLITDKEQNLIGWRNIKTGDEIISRPEKKEHEILAYSGIQLISTGIFKKLPSEKVFSIIPAYLDLAVTEKIKCYIHDDTRWLDIGKPGSLDQAKLLFPEIANS